MIKTIKISVKGATTLELNEFTELQGELKSLSKQDFEALKGRIKEHGFSYTVHIWQNEGKNFILDGHQRIRTVKKMVEEGWECPPIPVSIVEADNYEQAKDKLLAAASQYGKMENDGLLAFIQDMNLTPENLAENYRFADLDINKFIESNFDLESQGDINSLLEQGDVPQDLPPTFSPQDVSEKKEGEETPLPSFASNNRTTSHVRMVQLFFNDTTHPEFLDKVNAMTPSFEKENLTDTILEIVREMYKIRIENSKRLE